MALLFMDGVDHYTTTTAMAKKWDTVDVAAIETTGGRFGGGSIRMASTNDIDKDITLSTTLVVGFAIKIDGLPNGSLNLMDFSESAIDQVDINLLASGALHALRGGTVFGTTAGGVITTDTWHYVEIKIIFDNMNGQIIIDVDGTNALMTAANLDTLATGTGCDNVQFLYAAVGEQHLDDIYILDGTGSAPQDDILGDCRIDNLMPDGDGNYTEFDTTFPASPTTHWDKVEEIGPDDDTSYNETTTNTDRDTFMMENLTAITSQTIFGVQQFSYARGTGGSPGNLRNKLRISSTDYDGTGLALTDAVYEYLLEMWDRNPNGDVAWIESVINGMESGYEYQASVGARVSQHGIEVLRTNTAPVARVSQVVVEVLRVGLPPVTRVFPIPIPGRVTLTGSGTRVFPVPLG
jgi:hypothetical protein